MNKFLNLIVILISIATVVSGLVQMISPTTVMTLIKADITATSAHFFGIVGMFMALFGGLMLHAVYSPRPQRPAIFWSALQKLGAFAAVGLGIINGIFGPLAASVALFDLFSGIFFLYYLKKIGK